MVGANRRKRIKAEVLLRDWQPVDGVVRILPAVVCPHVLGMRGSRSSGQKREEDSVAGV